MPKWQREGVTDGIPDARSVVRAGSYDVVTVRAKCSAFYEALMFKWGREGFASGGIPHARGSVVTCCDDSSAVRTEGSAGYEARQWL